MTSFQVSHSSTDPLSSTLIQLQRRTDCVAESGGVPAKGQPKEMRGGGGERVVDLSAINVGLVDGVTKDSTPTVVIGGKPNDSPRCDGEQQKGEDLDDSSDTLTPSNSSVTLTESSVLVRSNALTLTEISHNSTLLRTTLDSNASHRDSMDISSLQLKRNQDSDLAYLSLEKKCVDPVCPLTNHHYRHQTLRESAFLSSPYRTQTREKGNQLILMSHGDHTLNHLTKEQVVQTSITQSTLAPLHVRQDYSDHPTSADSVVLSKENIAMIVRSEMKVTLQVYLLAV